MLFKSKCISLYVLVTGWYLFSENFKLTFAEHDFITILANRAIYRCCLNFWYSLHTLRSLIVMCDSHFNREILKKVIVAFWILGPMATANILQILYFLCFLLTSLMMLLWESCFLLDVVHQNCNSSLLQVEISGFSCASSRVQMVHALIFGWLLLPSFCCG